MSKSTQHMLAEAVSLYRNFYRYGASDTIDAKAVGDVGISQHKVTCWDQYSKSWHREFGPSLNTRTTITVSRYWRARVLNQGIAACNDMLTIRAGLPITDLESEITYRSAMWLVQSRGHCVNVVSGYIASIGEYHYHGATQKKAVVGLKRKLSAAAAKPISDAEKQRRRAKRFERLCAKHTSVPVTRQDAQDIGACNSGIDHWLSSVGLDDVTETTVGILCQAYLRKPAPECAAAIRRAIRQHS